MSRFADDAVTGPVRLAEAIVKREFVKVQFADFASQVRDGLAYPSVIAPYVAEHVRRIRLRESNTAMLLWGIHV